MKRWEYLTLRWEATAERAMAGGWEYSEEWTVHHPDGTVQGSDNRVLNKLGSEGWELVAVLNNDVAALPVRGWPEASSPIGRHYYFKRPLE